MLYDERFGGSRYGAGPAGPSPHVHQLQEPAFADYIAEMETGSDAGQRRDRLAGVVALEGRKVRLAWQSGLREDVDLGPLLVRYARRPAAARDYLFRTVEVGRDGQSLVWSDGSEVSVAWVRDVALEAMSNAEFRYALGELGFSVAEASAHLGISTRSVGGYRRDRPIPRAIAMAVRFMLDRHSRR